MTPDELAKRLDTVAWRIAVGMELHAACSSTTRAKKESVLDDLINSTELIDLILAAEARGMKQAARMVRGDKSSSTIGAYRGWRFMPGNRRAILYFPYPLQNRVGRETLPTSFGAEVFRWRERSIADSPARLIAVQRRA